MKILAQKIFGKPSSDNSFLFFVYWASVIFYVFALILSIVFSSVEGHWVSAILFAVLFPILFRVVYVINARFIGEFSSGNKRPFIVISFVVGLVAIGIIFFILMLGGNVVINASKHVDDGSVYVSIGSLKGSYRVEEFTITQEGLIILPYKLNADEGKVEFIVKRDDEIVWSEMLSENSEGQVEFQATLGTYQIELSTEEAKDIKLEINLVSSPLSVVHAQFQKYVS